MWIFISTKIIFVGDQETFILLNQNEHSAPPSPKKCRVSLIFRRIFILSALMFIFLSLFLKADAGNSACSAPVTGDVRIVKRLIKKYKNNYDNSHYSIYFCGHIFISKTIKNPLFKVLTIATNTLLSVCARKKIAIIIPWCAIRGIRGGCHGHTALGGGIPAPSPHWVASGLEGVRLPAPPRWISRPRVHKVMSGSDGRGSFWFQLLQMLIFPTRSDLLNFIGQWYFMAFFIVLLLRREKFSQTLQRLYSHGSEHLVRTQ